MKNVKIIENVKIQKEEMTDLEFEILCLYLEENADMVKKMTMNITSCFPDYFQLEFVGAYNGYSFLIEGADPRFNITKTSNNSMEDLFSHSIGFSEKHNSLVSDLKRQREKTRLEEFHAKEEANRKRQEAEFVETELQKDEEAKAKDFIGTWAKKHGSEHLKLAVKLEYYPELIDLFNQEWGEYNFKGFEFHKKDYEGSFDLPTLEQLKLVDGIKDKIENHRLCIVPVGFDNTLILIEIEVKPPFGPTFYMIEK